MSICTNPIELAWAEHGSKLADDKEIRALSAKMKAICDTYRKKLDSYSGDDPDAEEWLLEHSSQYNEEIASVWKKFVKRAALLGVYLEE